MNIAVLIPAYQPDAKLVGLVEALRTDFPHIVVVDDGSTGCEETFGNLLALVGCYCHLDAETDNVADNYLRQEGYKAIEELHEPAVVDAECAVMLQADVPASYQQGRNQSEDDHDDDALRIDRVVYLYTLAASGLAWYEEESVERVIDRPQALELATLLEVGGNLFVDEII